MVELTVTGLAVGYLTFVVVYSKVFAWGRSSVENLYLKNTGSVVKYPFGYIHEMLQCPFCASFWISAGAQLFLGLNVVTPTFAGVVVTTFAITAVGSTIGYCFGCLTNKIVQRLPEQIEADVEDTVYDLIRR